MAVIDNYVLDMRRRGLAPGTVLKRRRCVELLAMKHSLATVSSEEIQAFLDTRQLNARTRYCWLSHLSMFFASRLVGRHLRAVGCTHDNAHRLRHRFASALLEAGADIADVSQLLGHVSLATTQGYAQASLRRMRRALLLIS